MENIAKMMMMIKIAVTEISLIIKNNEKVDDNSSKI